MATLTIPRPPRRTGRPFLSPTVHAARRARISAELACPQPDLAAVALELGITREHVLRIVRLFAPGACSRGKNLLSGGERQRRLARLRAELLEPEPNLKAASYDLGISVNLAGLILRRDLGYRRFYASDSERKFLLASRRSEFSTTPTTPSHG